MYVRKMGGVFGEITLSSQKMTRWRSAVKKIGISTQGTPTPLRVHHALEEAFPRGVGTGLMGGAQEVLRSLSRVSGLCPRCASPRPFLFTSRDQDCTRISPRSTVFKSARALYTESHDTLTDEAC